MASRSFGYAIPAVCRSDDFQVRVKFDCADWFVQAGDDEIRELHRAGYRGEAADALAYHSSDNAGEVAKGSPVDNVFRYLKMYKPRKSDGTIIGFEVSVDPRAVCRWLDARRPALRAELFPEYIPTQLESLAC